MVLNEVVRDMIREVLVNTSFEREVIVSNSIAIVRRDLSRCRESV